MRRLQNDVSLLDYLVLCGGVQHHLSETYFVPAVDTPVVNHDPLLVTDNRTRNGSYLQKNEP